MAKRIHCIIGISLGYLWNISGISPEYLWNISGISLENLRMMCLHQHKHQHHQQAPNKRKEEWWGIKIMPLSPERPRVAENCSRTSSFTLGSGKSSFRNVSQSPEPGELWLSCWKSKKSWLCAVAAHRLTTKRCAGAGILLGPDLCTEGILLLMLKQQLTFTPQPHTHWSRFVSTRLDLLPWEMFQKCPSFSSSSSNWWSQECSLRLSELCEVVHFYLK